MDVSPPEPTGWLVAVAGRNPSQAKARAVRKVRAKKLGFPDEDNPFRGLEVAPRTGSYAQMKADEPELWEEAFGGGA
jgi:hypothetical protein